VISVRYLALLSTFFLVTGALLVGDAIHGSVVTGQYPVTSPAAVVRAVVGLVCIAIGYRFQTPTSEYTSVPSESSTRADERADTVEEDFDPEMSPLSDEQFENLDADEEK
jgi:xanthosine utilization system XapX-like protein